MIKLSQGSLEIVGDPLHSSKETLLSKYSDNYANYLETESKNSAGSYLVHDPNKERILTSPGYCGGYISTDYAHSTLLPLLEQSDQPIRFDSVTLHRYLSKSRTSLWPFRSLFENINRLPPGSIIEYGKEKSFECYISYRKATFEDAIENAVAPLQSKDSVTLMYSGGVDSTALYAALQSELQDTELSVVSIDIGPNTNSQSRAMRIGNEFGIDVSPLDFGWPPKNKCILNYIFDKMENDIVSPMAPHHAFATTDHDIVLSGQNFDAMLTCDMHRPQITWKSHFRATNDIQDLIKIVSNMKFTRRYQQHILLQKLLTIPFTSIKDGWEGDYGTVGYLAGFISSGRPNILSKNINQSKSLVQQVCKQHDIKSVGQLSDIINYYIYQHNANKGITTQDVRGTSVYLPAMWGPFASRHLGRQRPVSEALQPKAEVYKYVKKRLGKSYKNIAYPSLNEYRKQLKSENEFKLSLDISHLKKYQSYLCHKQLRTISSSKDYDIFKEKISNAKEVLQSGEANKGEVDMVFKLFNICILTNKLGT